MSVIIRLQNLPWAANALDIRQFFHGLSIPEGGVHIVGGEQGDAFIAFSTDEDARQAFGRANGKIKEVQITLMLSSRTEMQKVIETARVKSYAAFMQNTAPAVPLPAAVPHVMPAAVPELKKENSQDRDKKDRTRRSRSRSRERKERDRRDRKYRDRSRSRSRERRDRRRRERSRSRGRSRSKERKSRDRKKSPDVVPIKEKKTPEIWAPQGGEQVPQRNPQSLLGAFPGVLPLPALNGRGNFQPGFGGGGGRNNRENWQAQCSNDGGFLNRSEEQFNGGKRFPPRGNFREEFTNDREPVPNSCVRVKPFFGGYGDIRRFFQGLFISNIGIKFINDNFGHRTGEVFIQFGHLQGKTEALRKNGELLNGAAVQVVHIDDEQFDNAVDRYQPDNYNDERHHKFRSKNITKYFNKPDVEPKVFSCLTVEDLPTYVKEQDILKMFSNHPLISLFLSLKPRGGHIAYVQFGSEDEARKALEEQSNHIVEGKPVTVKPCDDKEFESISEQHNMDMEPKETHHQIDTECISINRLPLQTNQTEIADFFSDIGLRPLQIHLITNRMGFTGQAYCEFKSPEEASEALKKDNSSFGANNVMIEPCSREDMMYYIQEAQAQHVANLPPLIPRLQSLNPRPPFFPRGGFDGPIRPPRFQGARMPMRPRFQGIVSDDIPGCTIYMDNVPYKAGTNEILDFFHGYDISNNVSRRFNPNNTPSAEAKVVFNSQDEAFRAIQEKNGQKIWERPIYLKLV